MPSPLEYGVDDGSPVNDGSVDDAVTVVRLGDTDAVVDAENEIVEEGVAVSEAVAVIEADRDTVAVSVARSDGLSVEDPLDVSVIDRLREVEGEYV